MYFLTDTIYLPDSSIGLQRHISDPLRECSNICMTFIARSVILLLTVLGTKDSFAQNRNIPVSIVIETPPTCSIAKLKDLDFGVLGKPTAGINHGNGINGPGYAVLDERFEGDIMYDIYGVESIGGTPTVGKLKITASNTNTLTVTFDFPSYLIKGDNESSDPKINYDVGFYAHSTSEDGPWARQGAPWNIFTEEEDATGIHYFQIGGQIEIRHDTVAGHYDNVIAVRAACL